jgi:hypothetical protein
MALASILIVPAFAVVQPRMTIAVFVAETTRHALGARMKLLATTRETPLKMALAYTTMIAAFVMVTTALAPDVRTKLLATTMETPLKTALASTSIVLAFAAGLPPSMSAACAVAQAQFSSAVVLTSPKATATAMATNLTFAAFVTERALKTAP